jgi:hypothetical protein
MEDNNQRNQLKATTDEYNLLVVLLDLNLHAWGRRNLEKKQLLKERRAVSKSLISLPQFINQVMVFLNAYLISDSKNKLAIVATSYHSRFVVILPRFKMKIYLFTDRLIFI